jgi:hypothetical protein
MKKFSSGALTREQKALQDENYRDRHAAGVEYDYLVIGTGNAALTCASLLSNRGMDPQKSAELIGWQHFPKRDQDKLKYEYSDNGVMVYLGLKPGFDPARYGLGNHNTWHCLDWGMNTMWEAGKKLDVEHAWFISTPTIHGNDSGNVAPDGGTLLNSQLSHLMHHSSKLLIRIIRTISL